MGAVDIKSLTLEELRAWATEEFGLPAYRGEQIFRWVHGRGARAFDEMTDLGKELRERLLRETELGGLELDEVLVASDGTRKMLLRTARDERIESVLWRSLRRARDTRRRIRAESAPRLSLEIDRLTGAGTRGQLEITLHHELIHGARFRRSLGILRVRVADMESMPRVSRRMMKVLRDTDLVFRSETLELLAVLPETDIAEAAIVRDRLLAALEDGERVSWIGTAASEPHGTEVTPLLQRAGEPGH